MHDKAPLDWREPAKSVFYHPELDGLRFLAFLAVFIHHSLPFSVEHLEKHGIGASAAHWISAAVKAGGFGVDLFFCLSAYLITELLLREYQVFNTIDIRMFLIRRCLRIWPLYFFFIFFAVAGLPLLSMLVPIFGSDVVTWKQFIWFLVFLVQNQLAFC